MVPQLPPCPIQLSHYCIQRGMILIAVPPINLLLCLYGPSTFLDSLEHSEWASFMPNVTKIQHLGLRALTAVKAYYYIAKIQLHKHKNLAAAVELNLKILAPLLQGTSIDRCALFMRAKEFFFFNSYLIKILPLSLSLFLNSDHLSSLSSLIISSLSLSQLSHCCQPTPTLLTHAIGSRCRPTPPTHLALYWFFFFFFAVGCGMVVVVWVDWRQWVAGFNVSVGLNITGPSRPKP